MSFYISVFIAGLFYSEAVYNNFFSSFILLAF